MVKEAKSVFWDLGSLLFFQALALPMGVVYASIIARNLGPQHYGSLGLFLSVMQFIFCICVNWSGTAVLKFGKDELFKKNNMSNIFWGRSLLIVVLLAVSFLVLFFVRPLLQNYLQINAFTYWLIPLLTLVYSLSDYAAWLLKTTNTMKPYAFSPLLRQAVLLFLVSVLFLFGSRITLSLVIMIEVFSYTCVGLFAFAFIRRNVFLPFVLDKGKIKEMLFYSWPLFFSLLGGYTMEWIDLIIIKHYFTFSEAGIYQAAYRIFFLFSNSLSAITTVFFPVLMAASLQSKNNLIRDFYVRRLTPQVTLLWGAFISLLLVFSRPIFDVIFSRDYTDAIFSFKIICLGLAAQVISYLYSVVLYTFTSLKKVALFNIIATAIKVTLDLILIPAIGINGAALSTSVTILFSAAAYTILTQKYYAVTDYRSFYLLFFPAVVFIFSVLLDSLFVQVLFFILAASVFIFISKQIRIFSGSDIPLLNKIFMPVFLKRAITHIYLVMS